MASGRMVKNLLDYKTRRGRINSRTIVGKIQRHDEAAFLPTADEFRVEGNKEKCREGQPQGRSLTMRCPRLQFRDIVLHEIRHKLQRKKMGSLPPDHSAAGGRLFPGGEEGPNTADIEAP